MGLFEYTEGKIIGLPGGKFFSEKICLTILPVSENKVLVGTYNSRGLYLFDIETGQVDENWVDPAVNDRIQKVYCGARMANGDFIIGTVNGDGIYVLDSTGKWIGLWNPESGVLEDDQIYALYADQQTNELWVCVTASITRLYTELPYSAFSEGMGIDAVVNGINLLDDIVYAATDKGVYRSVADKGESVSFE
jgi:ligand-binding sensor domain-containing protein